MAKSKDIGIFIICNDIWSYETIPDGIKEVEFKECLRDWGYILSSSHSDTTTEIYMLDENRPIREQDGYYSLEDIASQYKKICNGENRFLKDLGIVEGSKIFI